MQELMKRQNIASNTEWEKMVGYSRAVKIGNTIEISGTVAVDNNGEIVGIGSEYLQTKFILQKIQNTLIQAGSSLEYVVRTRIFCTNISQWVEIGKAHKEFFENICPATTMVEVSALINKDYLVEIEATAFYNE